MIRAFLVACGTFITLCGALLFCVDRIELTDYAGTRLQTLTKRSTLHAATSLDEVRAHASNVKSDGAELSSLFSEPDSSSQNGRLATPAHAVLDPPDWGAVGLLSIGVVMLLYTIVVPGRRMDDEDCDDDC